MAEPKGNLVTPVGHRADGTIRSLELTDDDHLIVQTDNMPTSILIQGKDGGSVARYVKTDAYGRVIVDMEDGGVLNPYGIYYMEENTSLATGTNDITLITVGASQRLRLRSVLIRYTGTVAGVTLTPFVDVSGTEYFIERLSGLASGIFNRVNSDILLNPDTILKVKITGATLNDDFRGYAFAERIR